MCLFPFRTAIMAQWEGVKQASPGNNTANKGDNRDAGGKRGAKKTHKGRKAARHLASSQSPKGEGATDQHEVDWAK